MEKPSFYNLPYLKGRDPRAYDKQWYHLITLNRSYNDPFTYLGGEAKHRKQQKEDFISGKIKNPVLDYPDINIKDIDKREKKLLEIKEYILKKEKREFVRQAYRWRINEFIAGFRMLKATAAGDTKKFQRYTEYIYGKPSVDIFSYSVEKIRANVEKYLDSDNLNQQRAAQEFFDALPTNLPEAKAIHLPDQDTVACAKKIIDEEFSNLFELPPGKEELDAEDIRLIASQILKDKKAFDWEAIITDGGSGSSMSVDQERKKFKIPETKTSSPPNFTKTARHEAGGHFFRRIQGEQSRLRLLGIGLDRYDMGEEGVTTVTEQATEGTVEEFAGLSSHLAISLAVGLDGKPRNFRDTYEWMKKYFTFLKVKNGKDLTTAETEAQSNAWAICVRTFRGTDCSTPGVCFTKDIVYREGNIRIWGVLEENPDEAHRFSMGKYDPANNRHIWILNQKAISDQDLENLEK